MSDLESSFFELDSSFIIVPDDAYLKSATDLRAIVKGRAAFIGNPASYRAAVVGVAPDSGAQITVASYDFEYEKKSTATKRSRQLLNYVKHLRRRGS